MPFAPVLLILIAFFCQPVFAGWIFNDFDQVDEEAFPGFYLEPNEFENFRYGPMLSRKGGVYLGVGTFRTLNLAATADFDYLILFDANQNISRFNRANLKLILECENREEYLAGLTGFSTDEIFRLKDQGLGLDQTRTNVQPNQYIEGTRIFALLGQETPQGISRFSSALSSIANQILNANYKNFFFTDESKYQKIRKLVLEDKISVVTGNLAGEKSLRFVADALKKSNMFVNVVDVSNSFDYIRDENSILKVLKNFKQLPYGQNSKILLTLDHEETVPTKFKNVLNSDGWGYFGFDPQFFFLKMTEVVKLTFFDRIVSHLIKHVSNGAAEVPPPDHLVSVIQDDCESILNR